MQETKSSQELLNVSGLSFSYEKEPVLQDISFSIRPGESVGLIGANGAGKSTLLRLLVGLELSFAGQIRVDGLSMEKKNLPAIRERIGFVFQDSESQLFMTTVEEDVAFGPRSYGYPEDEVAKRVQEALSAVRITHLREKSIYKLSGGEKKLASIATILSMNPRLILMDEPSVALDPKNRRNLIQVIRSLPGARLLASHDLDFILDTCDRVLLISRGQIVADSPAGEILRDEALLTSHDLELPLSLQQR